MPSSIPLAIAAPVEDYHELSPSNYGFTDADLDRKIFIDNVLGLEYATVREMVEILERTYCSTIGVEFMHMSTRRKVLDPGAHRRAGQGCRLHARGQEGDPAEADRGEGFEQFIDVKYKGTKRFGLDGGESLIPALEQIIKRGGQLGMKKSSSAWRTRPSQRSDERDGQAAPRRVPRVQGRLLRA